MAVRWRNIGMPNSVDHLLDERALGITAWCGMSLDNAQEGGFRPRCGDCVREVRAFHREATADPPQRVVEVVQVRVVRHGKGDSVIDVLNRKLNHMRSWDYEISVVQPPQGVEGPPG